MDTNLLYVFLLVCFLYFKNKEGNNTILLGLIIGFVILCQFNQEGFAINTPATCGGKVGLARTQAECSQDFNEHGECPPDWCSYTPPTGIKVGYSTAALSDLTAAAAADEESDSGTPARYSGGKVIWTYDSTVTDNPEKIPREGLANDRQVTAGTTIVIELTGKSTNNDGRDDNNMPVNTLLDNMELDDLQHRARLLGAAEPSDPQWSNAGQLRRVLRTDGGVVNYGSGEAGESPENYSRKNCPSHMPIFYLRFGGDHVPALGANTTAVVASYRNNCVYEGGIDWWTRSAVEGDNSSSAQRLSNAIAQLPDGGSGPDTCDSTYGSQNWGLCDILKSNTSYEVKPYTDTKFRVYRSYYNDGIEKWYTEYKIQAGDINNGHPQGNINFSIQVPIAMDGGGTSVYYPGRSTERTFSGTNIYFATESRGAICSEVDVSAGGGDTCGQDSLDHCNLVEAVAGEESLCTNNADNSFNCIGTTAMSEDMISSPWQGSTNCQFTPPEMSWGNPPPYETGNLVDFGGSYVPAEGLRSMMRTEVIFLSPFNNIQASTVSYTPYNIPITADDTPSQPKSVKMDDGAEVTITVPEDAEEGENLVMGKLTGYENGGGGCRKKIEDADCESVNGLSGSTVDRIRACYSHTDDGGNPKCIHTDEHGDYIASAYKQRHGYDDDSIVLNSECGVISMNNTAGHALGDFVACDLSDDGGAARCAAATAAGTTLDGSGGGGGAGEWGGCAPWLARNHMDGQKCRTILKGSSNLPGGEELGWTPENHNTDQCHMENWLEGNWNTSPLKELKYRSDFSNVNTDLQRMCEVTISDQRRQLDGHGCEWIPAETDESSCGQREGDGINVCKLKDCAGVALEDCNNQGDACYLGSDNVTCHSCESPGPSCTETATGDDSNPQDADACVAVTGDDLNSSDACLRVMKTGSTERACTYTPAGAGLSPNCSKYSQKCNASNVPVCIEVASFDEGGQGGYIDSHGIVQGFDCPRHDPNGIEQWELAYPSPRTGILFSGISNGCMSLSGLDAGMTCNLQCANGYQFIPPPPRPGEEDTGAVRPQLKCNAGSTDVELSGSCERCVDDYTAADSGSHPHLGAHQYCETHSQTQCINVGEDSARKSWRKKCLNIGATDGLNHTALARIDEEICKDSGGRWTPPTGDNENGTCTLLTDWGGGELTSAKCAGNDPTSNIELPECKNPDQPDQPYKSPETCPQDNCNWVMLVDGAVKTVPGGTPVSDTTSPTPLPSDDPTPITHPIFKFIIGIFILVVALGVVLWIFNWLYLQIKEGWGGSDTQKINTPWFKRLAKHFSRVPGARMLN